MNKRGESRLKLFLNFLVLSFCLNSFSALKREKKLLHLVKVEISSIKKLKKRNDKLDYRLFELYSERVRLLRKLETHQVIKGTKGKKVAYKKSEQLYLQAQKYGHSYIRKYPKSRFIPDVYLKLAANVIEIRNDLAKYEKTIIHYLDKALEHGKTPGLQYRAKVVMAELFYNLKKFDQAEKYYKEVVKNKVDLAYTKNMLNYGWSMFQNRDYHGAIKVLKQSFLAWKRNPKYFDVNERIAQAVNYFNVYNKTPEDAIRFHAKHNRNNLLNLYYELLTLSQKIISPQKALIVESKSRKYCESYKDTACLFKLSEFKLQLYREGRDYIKHKVTPKQKEELKDTIDESINNIGEVTSFLQKFAYKGEYKINNSKESTYFALISNYDNLKVLNKVMVHEYNYLEGELSYKEVKFQNASKYYLQALSTIPKKSKDVKNNKKIFEFKTKLLDSMLALANEKTFKNDSFYEKSSTEYIAFYPKDKKSEKVYNNLFNFYVSKKNLAKGEGLIKQYHKNRSDKIKTHREMYTVLLSEHIKLKSLSKIADSIIEMKKGYLGFTPDFIDRNVKILGNLVFEKTQKLEKLGKKQEVLAEYKSIYDNTKYPMEIRLDGAFNLGVMKVKRSQVDEAYQWMQLVIKQGKKENLLKKLNPLLGVAEQLFLNQRLTKSKNIYSLIASKYCVEATDYPAHFLKLQEVNLATGDIASFKNQLNTAKLCKVPEATITAAKVSYVDYLVSENKTQLLLSEIKGSPKFSIHQDRVQDYLIEKFWSDFDINDNFQTLASYKVLDKFNFNNAYLSKEGRKKFYDIKTFINFAKTSRLDNLEVKAMQKFSLKSFEADFGRLMSSLEDIKGQGDKLVNASQEPNTYAATLAIVYDAFGRLKQNLEKFVVVTDNKDLEKQVNANLKQVVRGIASQESEYKQSYYKLKKKTPINTHFTKIFESTESRSDGIELSLGKNNLKSMLGDESK